MNRSFAGLVVLAAMFASAACNGLPKTLKAQIDAEDQQYSSARKEFDSARDEVRQDLAKQPALAKMRGLLWQPALDRDAEKLNTSAMQLKELRALREKDRSNSRGEVTQLLHGEQRLRSEALADVRNMQSEARRFMTLTTSLPKLDRDAEQLAATDLSDVTRIVQKAESDWPEKKSDLDRRLTAVKDY